MATLPKVAALVFLFAGAQPCLVEAEAFGHSTSRRRSAFASNNQSPRATFVKVGGSTPTSSRRRSAFASSNQSPCATLVKVGGSTLTPFPSNTYNTRILSATNGGSGEVAEEEGYESEEQQIAQHGFYIRRGTFRDLRGVAEIMMDCFYEESSIMYHYHRMLELDRVQNNFPYDSSRHDYFVACCPEGKIIGFVDIDARPSARKDAPPRPYLSDLAVSSKWRRRGIASRLVERCEAKAREMGKSKMYLRVEGDNDAALRMYCNNMAYAKRRHPVFGVKDTTILLRCDLQERLEMTNREAKESEFEATSNETGDVAIDYQV